MSALLWGLALLGVLLLGIGIGALMRVFHVTQTPPRPVDVTVIPTEGLQRCMADRDMYRRALCLADGLISGGNVPEAQSQIRLALTAGPAPLKREALG